MSRKEAYPVILTPVTDGYVVHIPDFSIDTEGNSIPEAMEMARDAIGIMGIDLEDNGQTFPKPYSTQIEKENGDIVTLVDIDFDQYRRRLNNYLKRREGQFECDPLPFDDE